MLNWSCWAKAEGRGGRSPAPPLNFTAAAASVARGGGIANFEGSPQTPEALGLVAEAAAAHGDGEGAELVGDEVALEDGLARAEIPGVGGDPVNVVMGIGLDAVSWCLNKRARSGRRMERKCSTSCPPA